MKKTYGTVGTVMGQPEQRMFLSHWKSMELRSEETIKYLW